MADMPNKDDGGGGDAATKKLKTFKFKGPYSGTITLIKTDSSGTKTAEQITGVANETLATQTEDNSTLLKGIALFSGAVNIVNGQISPAGSQPIASSPASAWASGNGLGNNVVEYEDGSWNYTVAN